MIAQFDALYPFTADLRAAAETRPYFRLTLDYATTPPAIRSFSPLVSPIKLAKVLTAHAILALDVRRPT